MRSTGAGRPRDEPPFGLQDLPGQTVPPECGAQAASERERRGGLEQGDVSHIEFRLPSDLPPVLPKWRREAGRQEGPRPHPHGGTPPSAACLSCGETLGDLPSAGGGAGGCGPHTASSVDIASPLTAWHHRDSPSGLRHTHADKMGIQQCVSPGDCGPRFLLSESRDLAVRHGSSAARLCGPLCRRIFPVLAFWRGAGKDRSAAVHPLAVRYRHSVG